MQKFAYRQQVILKLFRNLYAPYFYWTPQKSFKVMPNVKMLKFEEDLKKS